MPDPELSEAALAGLVDAFYGRVRADALLGPIFDGAVHDWPEHLQRLQAFWSSVMRGTGRYKGRPVPVHLALGSALTPQAFARWLALWRETTAERFSPAAAAALQDKADRIAESLQLAIEFQRGRFEASPAGWRLGGK